MNDEKWIKRKDYGLQYFSVDRPSAGNPCRIYSHVSLCAAIIYSGGQHS